MSPNHLAKDRYRPLKPKLVDSIILMWFVQSGLPVNKLRKFHRAFGGVLRERTFEFKFAEQLEHDVRDWVIDRARNGVGTTR